MARGRGDPRPPSALPGADGLILPDVPVVEARQVVEVLNADGRTVRWMHFLTAGREGFEAAGLPANVDVTYAAGAVAPAVAEHAMALLLALGRRVPEMVAQGKERHWDRGLAARATSLEGKTMLIVGLGQIGVEVARRARGFGMHLEALSRSGQHHELVDACHPLDEFTQRIADADVVVLSITLAPATAIFSIARRSPRAAVACWW